MNTQASPSTADPLQQATYLALVEIRRLARMAAGLSNAEQREVLRVVGAIADAFHNGPMNSCSPRQLQAVLEKAALHGLRPTRLGCLAYVVEMLADESRFQ
jgi:hypothetical protein